MKNPIPATRRRPRVRHRWSDSYEIDDEDFVRPDRAFKDLVRVVVLRSVMGKAAWPLPTDREREA
jgi:hypothetical protein